MEATAGDGLRARVCTLTPAPLPLGGRGEIRDTDGSILTPAPLPLGGRREIRDTDGSVLTPAPLPLSGRGEIRDTDSSNFTPGPQYAWQGAPAPAARGLASRNFASAPPLLSGRGQSNR
jgi:hypothetical protein